MKFQTIPSYDFQLEIKTICKCYVNVCLNKRITRAFEHAKTVKQLSILLSQRISYVSVLNYPSINFGFEFLTDAYFLHNLVEDTIFGSEGEKSL